MKKMKYIIKLMRPKHYIKNLLVFVSITFDRNLFCMPILGRVIGGFFVFSLLSSTVYIINDIHDVEADRKHEVKKNRPIASGCVTIAEGCIVAVVAFVCSLGLHFGLRFSLEAFIIMMLYFGVNLGYSMGLKDIPFVDIALLVSGFLLRVLYGAAIIDSTVSEWVYLAVIALSFYLGLGKRRNEMKKIGSQKKTRRVLEFYSYEFLDKFMYLCLTLAIAFYALWSADEKIVEKYGTNKLMWTVPMVMLVLMKYSANIEQNSHGDPVDVILHDKMLILLSVIYGGVLLCLIYKPWG